PTHRLLYNTTLAQFFPLAGPAGRATHSTDMFFLFAGAPAFTLEQQAVQADMYNWIANLAVTGDVNNGPAGSPPIPGGWPAFVPGSNSLLVVNELHQYTSVTEWQEAFCDQWRAALYGSSDA